MPATKGTTRSATTVPSSSPGHDPAHHDSDEGDGEDTCRPGCPAYNDTPAHQAARGGNASGPTVWARLAEPFPPEDIEKLPRNLKRNDDDKGRCEEGSRYSADGFACHGYHARSIHLDYVGHAGITMRLNDVLGPGGWDFQPYALDQAGLPIMGQTFWATLTIEGVTKADLAANYSGPQEAWGDALRRCAMRFGIGTYLWSKSETALEMAKAAAPEPPARGEENQAPPEPTYTPAQYRLRNITMEMSGPDQERLREWWRTAGLPKLENLSDEDVATVEGTIRGMLVPDPS